MPIELVHIGFSNIIAMNRVIAIASPNSSMIKRAVKAGEDKGLIVDMTNGRKTRSALFTDSGHIILAALTPEAIAGRLQASRAESNPDPGASVLKLEPSDEKGVS